MTIKCSEDSCRTDGNGKKDLEVFPGTKELISLFNANTISNRRVVFNFIHLLFQHYLFYKYQEVSPSLAYYSICTYPFEL